MSEHRFQINLRGIIDLLSNHLYSGPQVFVRELLQNAVDAIRARADREPGFQGEIHLECVPGPEGRPPSLVFEDNGIGLTEEEIHTFLSTIGLSSKRDDLGARRGDFIGQFGIGLLSAFIVSDEITLITRAARPGAKAFEWKGRPDGTYTLRTLQGDLGAGTRVYLRAKPEAEEYFQPGRLRELAAQFGGLLPSPIFLKGEGNPIRVNGDLPPWKRTYATRKEEDAAYRDYGRQTFGGEFFDWIPLRSIAGGVEGVAYILPHSTSAAAKAIHRISLRGMLLSEASEGILPDWAFFVRCAVNARDLRPTASRESFQEDALLEEAREELGDCLRRYLVDLSTRDPERMQQLLGVHFLPIKSLALEDDDFFALIIDWLPFETTLGTMTFAEFRSRTPDLRYARTVDEFRQIAQVAAAQNIAIINAGYTYDSRLLERYGELHPEASVAQVRAEDLAREFDDLEDEDRDRTLDFLDAAEQALRPFRCGADLKRFKPVQLPALYAIDAEASFRRTIDQAKDVANPLFSSLLDGVAQAPAKNSLNGTLTLNFDNPLVQQLTALKDPALRTLSLEILYVQSLLLGHHPLHSREMEVLNRGMRSLLERSLGASS